jgi:cell division protease FtsH
MSGRFDRQIVIDVPDVKGRVEILKIHMRKRPIDANVDLLQIAKQVPGFTGAELANVVNEAALLAVRSRRETITQVDLEEAVDRVLAGPERRSHVLTDEEKLVIAYHEAGHAVVARGAGQQTGVLKLSIVARGLQLGHATTYSSADRMLQLRSEIEAQLATLLGGLATERVVFGEISTGNGGDLEKATTLARKVVATWGMTDAVGRVQVLNEGQVFMGREFGSASHTSQDALNAVDAEMRRILDEAEARAERIVRANRSIVDDLAHALLERESMVGPEVDPYLARVQTLAAPMPVKELVARELRVEGMVPSRTSNGRKKPANL